VAIAGGSSVEPKVVGEGRGEGGDGGSGGGRTEGSGGEGGRQGVVAGPTMDEVEGGSSVFSPYTNHRGFPFTIRTLRRAY